MIRFRSQMRLAKQKTTSRPQTLNHHIFRSRLLRACSHQHHHQKNHLLVPESKHLFGLHARFSTRLSYSKLDPRRGAFLGHKQPGHNRSFSFAHVLRSTFIHHPSRTSPLSRSFHQGLKLNSLASKLGSSLSVHQVQHPILYAKSTLSLKYRTTESPTLLCKKRNYYTSNEEQDFSQSEINIPTTVQEVAQALNTAIASNTYEHLDTILELTNPQLLNLSHFTTVATVHSRSGKLHKIQHLLDRMSSIGVKPDIRICTTYCCSLIQFKKYPKLLGLIKDLSQNKAPWDQITEVDSIFIEIIFRELSKPEVVAKYGDTTRVILKYYEPALQKKFGIESFATYLHCLAKNRLTRRALQIFLQTHAREPTLSGLAAFNTALNTALKLSEFTTFDKILQILKESPHLTADKFTWHIQMKREMREKGVRASAEFLNTVPVDAPFYNFLITNLSDQGEIGEALRLYNTLLEKQLANLRSHVTMASKLITYKLFCIYELKTLSGYEARNENPAQNEEGHIHKPVQMHGEEDQVYSPVRSHDEEKRHNENEEFEGENEVGENENEVGENESEDQNEDEEYENVGSRGHTTGLQERNKRIRENFRKFAESNPDFDVETTLQQIVNRIWKHSLTDQRLACTVVLKHLCYKNEWRALAFFFRMKQTFNIWPDSKHFNLVLSMLLRNPHRKIPKYPPHFDLENVQERNARFIVYLTDRAARSATQGGAPLENEKIDLTRELPKLVESNEPIWPFLRLGKLIFRINIARLATKVSNSHVAAALKDYLQKKDRSRQKPFEANNTKPFEANNTKTFEANNTKTFEAKNTKTFDANNTKTFEAKNTKTFEANNTKTFEAKNAKTFDANRQSFDANTKSFDENRQSKGYTARRLSAKTISENFHSKSKKSRQINTQADEPD